MARPSDYDPAFCDQVIKLGKTGASKAEMAAELGVVRQTLDNWCEQHPEFLDAIKQAVSWSQAWWEKQGRIATFGGTDGFNATAFIFNMKNRFPADWKDKVEQEQSGKVDHTHRIERIVVDPTPPNR